MTTLTTEQENALAIGKLQTEIADMISAQSQWRLTVTENFKELFDKTSENTVAIAKLQTTVQNGIIKSVAELGGIIKEMTWKLEGFESCKLFVEELKGIKKRLFWGMLKWFTFAVGVAILIMILSHAKDFAKVWFGL
jgi:hypothetical protein